MIQTLPSWLRSHRQWRRSSGWSLQLARGMRGPGRVPAKPLSQHRIAQSGVTQIIFTGQSLRCQDLLPGYLQAVSRHKYWDQCQPLEIFRNKFVPSERRQRYFCFETRVSCSKSFVTRYDECGPGDLWLVSYEAFIRPHLIIHQS